MKKDWTSSGYYKRWSIYNMLNKGIKIPQKWIDEEENDSKKKWFEAHNRRVEREKNRTT